MLLGIFLIFSCGEGHVSSIRAENLDGSPLTVKAKNAKTAHELNEKNPIRKYSIAPVVSGQGSFSIELETDGSISLELLAGGEDRIPALSQTLQSVPAGSTVFNIPFAGRIAAFSLELGTASFASLKAVKILPHRTVWQSSPLNELSTNLQAEFGMQNLPVRLRLDALKTGDNAVELIMADAAVLEARGKTGWRVSLQRGAKLYLPLSALGSTPIQFETEGGISSLRVYEETVPQKNDLYSIINSEHPGGPYTIWRWDLLPETLVMDFDSYATQDIYLKRLAFFAEKPGFRGRLARDSEIAHLHGWNAHDYPSWAMADFFEKARKENFPLNQAELELREILLACGILHQSSAGDYYAGEGALISVSRESLPYLRRMFIDHEASHALFFMDENYRRLAQQLWDSHSRTVREFWNFHLSWRNYDISDKYLCVNELQAYLVQQRPSDAGGYLERSVFPQLTAAYPGRAEWLDSVKAEVLAQAVSDARALDSYLEENYGIGAGAFGRLYRLPD